jgi:hypothetical protein
MSHSRIPACTSSTGGVIVFAVLLFLTHVPIALAAGGVNLNWGAGCWSDGTPLENLSFPCDTNAGRAVMTCSFAVWQPRSDFVGVEITLEGVSAACAVPAWWQMGSGECRSSALTASADFLEAPQVGCTDIWQNHALGGIASYQDGPVAGGPRKTHLLIGYALTPETPVPIQADVEYYAASIRIAYTKTVGDGSCPGCGYGFIWGLSSVKAAGMTSYEMLFEPLPNGNQCIRWQNARATCYSGFWEDCLTPARTPTWGQIKGLYH